MRIHRLVSMVFLAIASPAVASGAPAAWTVSQKSGDVLVYHPGMQAASVQVNASLTPGDVVSTGPNGRAMLTRGNDYVVVAPSSRLLLPKEVEQSGFTRLVQQVGTMLYKVHHTGLPHFAVQTPMLAAVVKGTSFTVIVDHDRAAVQVTEGVVEVSPAVGQAHRLVQQGMTVYVGREKPDTIVDLKRGVLDMPKSAPEATVKVAGTSDVPIAMITNLTGGLVHAAIPPVIAVAQPVTEVIASTPEKVVSPVTATASQPASGPAAPTTVVATTTNTVATVAQTSAPVISAVQTTAQTTTQPVVNAVQTTVTAVIQPVVNVVQTTVPAITQPVVNVVQTTVPAITQPVVNVVQTTVPAITQPVVNVVQTTLPVITQPVVNVVATVAPVVVPPVTNLVTGLLGH